VTTPSAPYLPGVDAPHFNSTGGPSCPTAPATSLSATRSATGPLAGLGSANSPAESEFINELMGPASGQQPSAMPQWSSLLLGPLLRGATVTLK
jgi:phospholipid/cholesterol/gamma-HCH transport system substrate-binding protein